MQLTDLLQGPIGQQLISGAASQLGVGGDQAQSAVGLALPMILGALNQNASTPEGAAALDNAIATKHDGSILDSLGSIFGGSDPAEQTDGKNILGHIFGGQTEGVANSISQSSGLSSTQVMSLLATLAPIVLGLLGQQKQQQGLDSSGLSGLLGNIMGGGTQQGTQQSGLMGMVSGMLDKNGNGMTDEVMSIGTSLLGSLFKK